MLDKTKDYLQNSYPYTGNKEEYSAVVAELNAAIAESSVNGVTMLIRAMGVSCPAIVKLTDTGEYTFHRCAKKVSLEFEDAYISYNGFVNGFDDFRRTGEHVGDRTIFIKADHPIYRGYHLYQWLLWGAECGECGTLFLQFDEGSLCDKCESSYKTLEYNAKAEDILGSEDTKETLFGIELEYEQVTSRQVGKCLKGHAISKQDGSIRNGVEVVTRPACVATHKKSLQAFYDSVKVSAANNTGMHIHVDKSKLSNYQIGFMLEFLNKKDLIPHIEKVAGRSYSTNTYCRAVFDLKMSWGNTFNESSYKLVKKATQKYSPLNTAKDKTIEVRIFSSPESFEEMSAKLDFVAALVKYSSPYSVSVKSLKDKFTWEVFTDFVKMNKKVYPHFCSFFLKG